MSLMVSVSGIEIAVDNLNSLPKDTTNTYFILIER